MQNRQNDIDQVDYRRQRGLSILYAGNCVVGETLLRDNVDDDFGDDFRRGTTLEQAEEEVDEAE